MWQTVWELRFAQVTVWECGFSGDCWELGPHSQTVTCAKRNSQTVCHIYAKAEDQVWWSTNMNNFREIVGSWGSWSQASFGLLERNTG
jgi:hypothetical protein